MVVLIALFQTTEDANGTHLVGLIDHHRLETAFQGLVFLKVFLVLVERGGTDGTQFATGKGGFQNVGGIHGTFAGAGSYQCVNFVNKEDDTAIALHHLVDDALQSFLELSLIFGTGNQLSHVEGIDLFVFQILGHIATDDTAGKAFHDGSFTCTWLSDEYGVVFGAS